MIYQTCKCGSVIREYGKVYFDTLPSCTCLNPEAVEMKSTIVSTDGTDLNY